LSDQPFEVVDSSGLTDADWAEINRLQEVYKTGGRRALDEAMKVLAKDPVRFTTVIAAFFPDMLREALRDAMAEAGITEDDLQDIARKLESPAPDQ
jgi:hypothetical protein